MKRLTGLLVASLLVPLASAPYSHGQEILRTDVINVFFDPDSPLPGGQSLKDYYLSKKYVYVYREIIPTEVGGNTYFAMLGANSGYPDFYGGIQHFQDGTKAAIFSVWDVGSDGTCYTCQPGTAAPEKQVSVWAKGSRTVTRPFGGEGTGMNSMIYGFDWKLGQKVAMLASVEPAGTGSLISAAFKNGDEPWEFMTSFYVPTRYDIGMSGNYSFLEDWSGGAENTPRSYLVGPTYVEDDAGKGTYLTNALVGAHNPTGSKVANRHAISLDGTWLKVRSGIPVQPEAKPEYRFQLTKPSAFPDIREGKALLEKAVEGKSTRTQERNVRLELEAKIKAEADAKAAAELKLKQEADKVAADKAAAEKVIADAKAEAARIIADAKAQALAATKQTTISCVKGKLVKKVTAVKPVCPKGYKKK